MRSYYKNILLACALLTAAAACTKDDPGSNRVPEVPISITTSAPETKGMLDENGFQTSGNKIKVYDFVTSGNSVSKHIDDYIVAPKSDDPEYHWPFGSGTKHQWTAGTHKFFGWLLEDANMTSSTDAAANTPEEFFGSGFSFNETTHVLTIPAKSMTATTPQFDFMYSDVHTRDMDTNPYYSAVPLKFGHLFSAVSFGFINDATSDVTISSMAVNLYTSGSANVSFTNAGSDCTYTLTGKAVTFNSFSTSKNVPALSSEPNAFDFSDISKDYRLIWPIDKIKLANCSIYLTYTQAGQKYENLSFDFPEIDLEPGKRYHFDISFIEKAKVRINYEVVPWKTIDNEYTFE